MRELGVGCDVPRPTDGQTWPIISQQPEDLQRKKMPASTESMRMIWLLSLFTMVFSFLLERIGKNEMGVFKI